ncbi:NUDIX hydrolase [Rhizobium beringeri]|uniref:NUDIX hydrolase n=1 Tax=Rhizobium beringeri TaxID=3019934 RepID=UPI002E0FA640
MVDKSSTKSSVAVAVIVDRVAGNRSVLLVRRVDDGDACPVWVFPGGKIEYKETPICAAQRELREEAGMDARKPRVIGNRTHPISGVDMYYVGFGKFFDCGASHDEKIAEKRWVPVDDIERYVGGSLYSKVASYLKQGQTEHRFQPE